MEESKSDLAGCVKQIHSNLVVQIAELRDLEWKSRGALERDEGGVVLAVRADRKLAPLHARPRQVRAQARRQAVAMGTTVSARQSKPVQARHGIAIGQWFARSQFAAAQGHMAGQRQVGGQRIVELSVRVGRKTDRRQK